MLGLSIVHGDDGIDKLAGPGHVPQPDHPGGRLLRAADYPGSQFGVVLVQSRNQVGAVVHCDVRFMLQGGDDVLVVSVVILSLYGVHGNAVVDKGRSHVVLGRQGIRGTEDDLGATFLQGQGQVGCLGSDVQAGGDAHSLERLLPAESLLYRTDDRHLLAGPIDA